MPMNLPTPQAAVHEAKQHRAWLAKHLQGFTSTQFSSVTSSFLRTKKTQCSQLEFSISILISATFFLTLTYMSLFPNPVYIFGVFLKDSVHSCPVPLVSDLPRGMMTHPPKVAFRNSTTQKEWDCSFPAYTMHVCRCEDVHAHTHTTPPISVAHLSSVCVPSAHPPHSDSYSYFY